MIASAVYRLLAKTMLEVWRERPSEISHIGELSTFEVVETSASREKADISSAAKNALKWTHAIASVVR